MATIYLRKDTWWIKYQQFGKRVQKTLGVKDKKAAEIMKREIELNLDRGEAGLRPRVMLHDFLPQYLAYSAAKKAKATAAFDEFFLPKFVTGVRATYMDDLTAGHISSFMAKYHGHAPKTYNNYLITIKAMLNYAVKMGILASNPAANISKLRVPKEAPRYLTDGQISSLLHASAGMHIKPMIVCALLTGMRINEICSLVWEDVDMRKKLIYVRGDKSKSGTFRTIPIHDQLYPILDASKKNKKPSDFVFPTPEGKRYAFNPRESMRRLARVLGIKGFGWHILRHTYASHLVMKGASIYVVGDLLGHSSVEVTKCYAHLAPDFRSAQANLIEIPHI